ncbi:MAG: arginine--tRNA ligase [Egibacteraceae bacterium]
MSAPERLVAQVRAALAEAGLPAVEPTFERPRNREHGDWSTSVALRLAKPTGRPPLSIAEQLVAQLDSVEGIETVEIAGPGFINFRLSTDAFAAIVRRAVTEGERYGRSEVETGRRANVEFVSANPTGPLHLGHGRWVVIGDAIASLLEAVGWEVVREYYFNDAGTQMEKFGASVQAALDGREPPENGYTGAYVATLAETLRTRGNEDIAEDAYRLMLEQIDATLRRFGVVFDVYFGERTLHTSGRLDEAIARLRAEGHVYTADEATWLRTTDFGDDKDRVLLRSTGQPTYFAADCAYLVDKLERGFDRCIYVLGADHHGYVQRLHALERALGGDGSHVEVLIGQLVIFLRDGEPVRMSKRTGALVTLDELADDIGVEAARYALLRQSTDTALEIDLAEVVRQERDNPVYYVQYSSARIAGIIRMAHEREVDVGTLSDAELKLLVHPTEQELIRRVGQWPETVVYAARERAPHRVARYAESLAEAFHRFYTECTVLGEDETLTRARYWLVEAVRQTLVNALGLLGVDAPERM